MTQERVELRVQRTQKMLQEALIDLLAERSLEAISVGDIAERAMVNRATFYRHYQDKYDLMEKIFAEVLEQMMKSLGQPRYPVTNVDLSKPSPHWVKIFEHIGQNFKIYEAILGPRGNPWFVARMRNQIAALLREREELREKARKELGYAEQKYERNDPPIEFIVACVTNLLLGTISWWLEAGRPYSPEQMASWLVNFIARGYLYTIGNPAPEPFTAGNGS
jgi:AcrR family transcriptional regulator